MFHLLLDLVDLIGGALVEAVDWLGRSIEAAVGAPRGSPRRRALLGVVGSLVAIAGIIALIVLALRLEGCV
ncbi:MAG: hypothetical protein GF320_21565 [Armatimonadia bacterium]|nr:hypothetical protein [Armatimonadia bacterium]